MKQDVALSPEIESVLDDLTALKDAVKSLSYVDGEPTLEDLKAHSELVLGIRQRAREIDDEALRRQATRRLDAAKGWLPIALKALAAVAAVSVIVAIALMMNQIEFNEFLRSVFSGHLVPFGGAAAVGGGALAARKALKGRSRQPTRSS